MAPPGVVFRIMLRNSSGVWNRDCAVTVALSICVGGEGSPPTSPAATSVFWLWIAAVTSAGIS